MADVAVLGVGARLDEVDDAVVGETGAMRIDRRARDNVLLVLAMCTLFAVGNTAYRFGEGSAFAIAGHRGLVGCALFLPLCVPAFRDGRVREMLRDPQARWFIVSSGTAMVVVAVVLRTLTGPQAGLAIAIIPAAILVFTRVLGSHDPRALVPVLVSVALAVAAAASGGLGEFTAPRVACVVAMMLFSAVEFMLLARARRRHDTTVLLLGSMVVSIFLGYVGLMMIEPGSGLSATGAVAATVVGAAGASARWIRGAVVPRLGPAVSSSTAQISGLLTALGGVAVVGDSIEPLAGVLSLVAAGFALIAVTSRSRTAPPLDPAQPPVDLRPSEADEASTVAGSGSRPVVPTTEPAR